MKRNRLLNVAWLVAISLFALRVQAHHSLAVYDQTTLVTIKGTVAKVEWRNPHSWVTLSVKDTDGTTSDTHIEIAGPGSLINNGFTRELLRIGEVVTFESWLPKDGSDPAGRMLTLPDGRRFDVGDNWGGILERNPPR